MKVRTKVPNKMTAAGTAAIQKERLNEEYPKSKPLSNQKILLGELLLFGNKSRKAFWDLFEILLRQYWGAKE